jgi:hypothetical protein
MICMVDRTAGDSNGEGIRLRCLPIARTLHAKAPIWSQMDDAMGEQWGESEDGTLRVPWE